MARKTSTTRKSRSKIVEVTWEDACSAHGWDREPEGTTYFVKSVGILVRCDKQRVVIAQSIAENGSCAETLSMPARFVSQIRFLGWTVAQPS